MSEGKIVAEKQGHLGRVIFDNVKKHNAMSQAMWDGLADTIKAYDADDSVRVIVLEGAGKQAFVSGADISKFENERANVDRIKDYGVSVNRAYASVQHALKPTIAKINGYGYGHENTKVLMDLVGPSYTKEIFYTARRFSSEEAWRMGLVTQVVAKDELDGFVDGYVNTMAGNAPLSLKTTNLIVNEMLKDEDHRDMALCERLVEECAGSQDIEEGRKAFMEKRKPEFVGR
jgi:enoyl-CoA hydratase